MDITYRDLIDVCPSAMMPDESVFNAVTPFVMSRKKFICGVVTATVYKKTECLEFLVGDENFERWVSLDQYRKKYVCVSAFKMAVPHIDLALTPTGFGVVSNQNVAPASSERVSALVRQLGMQESLYLDEVIDLARPFVDWHESSMGPELFSTLFWKAEHMRCFGINDPTRSDLYGRMPDICYAAADISRKLSPELHAALCVAESNDSCTPMQRTLIAMWRQATVAHARNDGSCGDFVAMMLRFVENHLDDFPEYRDSQTYKANHFERYQNEKDDSCFFFG